MLASLRQIQRILSGDWNSSVRSAEHNRYRMTAFPITMFQAVDLAIECKLSNVFESRSLSRCFTRIVKPCCARDAKWATHPIVRNAALRDTVHSTPTFAHC